MLEEILKEINKSLNDIANCLKGNVTLEAESNKDLPLLIENVVPQSINQSVNAVQNTPIQNPVVTPQMQVPVNTQAESFTQEQIAVAMSNAMAAGKQDLVQNILKTFNAQCLMQIDSSNYNKIATMLREAGIKI